ncbi:MAG TPA: SMP-30/gluconolactonase/LRE family protein [Porticoccaceae bacterium]|nr:SMP-30/gluconolactonase/LRE family protein [Porticoccaceae bacterium]
MPSKLSIAAAALLAAAQISVLCAETLIADLPNLEDLHATGDNRWVIGSAMRAAGRGGALYAIASGGERVGALYPNDTAAAPATTQCPGGAPTATTFAPHGISLQGGEGEQTLYVVNHGGRESVEIFAVVPGEGGDFPRVHWRDCIPLPEGAQANSVTVADDGTVYVTAAGAPFAKGPEPDPEKTPAPIPGSGVLAWRPDGGWRVFTEGLALSNGLVISRDNRFLYAAEWLGRQVAEIATEDGAIQRRVAVDFGVDNLRLDADGGLWLAGQSASTEAVMSCYLSERADCGLGSALARVNSTTLAIDCTEPLPASGGFSGATVALPLGDRVWLGTFRGNAVRIAERGDAPGNCVD